MVSNHFMPMSLEQMANRSRVTPFGTKESEEDWTVEDLKRMGINVREPGSGATLNFDDFLKLMVQQLQNQTIDNTADTGDMMNQLVQMTTVEMLGTVKDGLVALVDATTLTYASSLVGKTVTVGKMNKDGELEEIVGTVTGAGTYQGTVVIFVDGEMYALSDIMAIGELPELPDDTPKPEHPIVKPDDPKPEHPIEKPEDGDGESTEKAVG